VYHCKNKFAEIGGPRRQIGINAERQNRNASSALRRAEHSANAAI